MTTERSSSGTQLLMGYLAALSAIVFNALSASCVQALQGAIPDFQLSAIRSIVQCLTFFIAGLIVSTDFKVGREYIPGLIYFGGLYSFYNVGYFGAATYLPLGEVQGIVSVTCLVFAITQSKVLFKKDIAKSAIIATLVCAVGIVLVMQPQWMFKHTTKDNTKFSHKSSELMLGYILSMIGGATRGVSYDIGGIILYNVKTIPKVAYTMSVCAVGSVAFMFYIEDPVYVPNANQVMLALGHSFLSAATSFLAIYAYAIVPGPSLSIVMSLEVVTMLAAQYTFMHSIQPGNYNWIEVCRCSIILFGASIPGVIDVFVHRVKANELP